MREWETLFHSVFEPVFVVVVLIKTELLEAYYIGRYGVDEIDKVVEFFHPTKRRDIIRKELYLCIIALFRQPPERNRKYIIGVVESTYDKTKRDKPIASPLYHPKDNKKDIDCYYKREKQTKIAKIQ
jgi:hypothetical protein